MAASSETLGKLHEAIAQTLLAVTSVRMVPVIGKDGLPVEDGEGNVLMEERAPSAAEISAAIAFLKNNNITATDEGSEATAKLREQLAARRKKSGPVLPDTEASPPAGMH